MRNRGHRKWPTNWSGLRGKNAINWAATAGRGGPVGNMCSRPNCAAQNLHHLFAGSRCLECRWSLHGRPNNIDFFLSKNSDCNDCTITLRWPRRSAIWQATFVAGRSTRRTAIPMPSRRTPTVSVRINLPIW